ncbi:hypothetical protein C8N46_10366 [Kordia periserrulae]|uniref:Uncharacterized protein n=1 Tax=Kordia periserrulae TaxID=701523 RepID=A0A2T6C0X7_9FLAO|nr:hypothetical protein [Kordia periserrulae]PTX61969.1 hypothetical protein C8N46_10366 [Kordia periserrulae]
MNILQKCVVGMFLLGVLHVSAQETESSQNSTTNSEIENYQLPTFSELSLTIANEYSQVHNRLPNLSNIGEHVEKSIRRGMLDEHSISTTFRNLNTEYSILPNITQKRFQLRDNLNTIMFNGFDANVLHLMGAWKGGQ